MKLIKQIFGICNTPIPRDGDCWSREGDAVVVDLDRAEELREPGGAMRLEGRGLGVRVLLFKGLDGAFYALKNKCTHFGGRRIDPTLEPDRIQCCSINGSVFNYKGAAVSGPARKPLDAYPVSVEGKRLVIDLKPS